MIKPIYILIIVYLSVTACKTETGNKQLSELDTGNTIAYQAAHKEIYKIIDAIADSIRIGTDKIRLLDSLPADFDAYKFLENEDFLEKNSDYEKYSSYKAELIKRNSEAKPYQLNPAKLSDLEIIPATSIDFNKSYEENKNIEPFFIVYSPLVTSDRKVAIISIDFVCFGLCGEGWSYVLMKENEKWVKIGTIYRWVS